MSTLWKVLTRKKVIDPARAEETSLARVLNTFDLTALGVGSTLGVGMYVLVGKVARETAGPSVVISFLIAAIASAFAGLCYAEFGARAPRAGSAYVYSYVCVGEFIAFVIGWNLILEYIIGSASVARGMSLYIDALLNDTLKNTFIEFAPIHVSFLSPYFDFLSFSIAIILSIGLAFGMKESSKINNVFTVLNIFVVLFVIIAGSTKADPKNWSLDAPTNVTNGGSGGFLPFGVNGMLKGAATCFYGFVGFDCIATTGEEVKNPQRAIPFAIVSSLAIVFLAYFGTATVVTLMVPYYLQDVNSPIPHAFDEFGWVAAKWIVTIGGIFALCASLFGAMFPLPRIIYAMASDGLVFKFLGKVSERFLTPVTGTLLAGLLTGFMAAIFEQGQLVDMMSIGTLLAYTIVAACVLLLRYVDDNKSNSILVNEERDYSLLDENLIDNASFFGLVKQFFNGRRTSEPTKASEKLVNILVCLYCLLCLLIGLCAIYLREEISHGVIYAIVLPSVCGLLMIIVLMSITTQPNSKRSITFKVPLVPLIPAVSILVNIYLMLSLDVSTWIRFGVWMAIGLPIYFYSAFSYKKDTLVLKEVKETGQNSFTNPSHVPDDTKGSVNSDSAYLSDENKANEDFPKNDSISTVNSNQLRPINNNFQNIIDRKVSFAESISNYHVEENVVAIIHREDEPLVETRNLSRANSVDECLAVMTEFDEMVKVEEEKLDVPEASNDLIINNAKTVEDDEIVKVGEEKLNVPAASNDLNVSNAKTVERDEIVKVGKEKFNVPVASNDLIVTSSKAVEIDEGNGIKSDSNNNERLIENEEKGVLNLEENTKLDEDIIQKTLENEFHESDEKLEVVDDVSNIVKDIKLEESEENIVLGDEEKELEKFESKSIKSLNSEDLNLENEKSSELSKPVEMVLPPPPPPPSMKGYETFKSKIPPISPFVKRRVSPRIPEPENGVVPEIEDVDDNVEFGSKQHEKIKEKLSKILLKNAIGFPMHHLLTKPEPKWEVNEGPVKNQITDEVIAEIPKTKVEEKDLEEEEEEEDIPKRREDFKKKLNNLLGSDKPNMYKSFPIHGIKDDGGDVKTGEKELKATENDSESKLTKTLSLSKTFPRSNVKKDEEREKHRERMANALTSINLLRKSED